MTEDELLEHKKLVKLCARAADLLQNAMDTTMGEDLDQDWYIKVDALCRDIRAVTGQR